MISTTMFRSKSKQVKLSRADNNVKISFIIIIAPSVFDDLKRSAAIWILKIKENHKLPQCAIKSIIEDVTILFQTYLSHLFDAVKLKLKSMAVVEEVILSLSLFFDPDGYYGKPFKGLETEYLQHTFFKKNFSMIVSSLLLLLL